MNKLLEDLKQACDVIVIDGTPCELVTDSVILSRIVDSTVIVTAHKETRKDNLERVIKNIQNVGGHLAGVVINKMPVSIKKYNENYYYASTSGSTLPSESRREIKDKTYNVLKQNNENYKNEIFKQNRNNIDNMDENRSNIEESMEKPSFLNNNSNDNVNKSQEILQQINSYLDNEKKNLN